MGLKLASRQPVGLLAAALCMALLHLVAEASQRSKAARSEFTRHNACPSTGRHRGPCPGFDVDHIVPLCAGGADHPSNMQWIGREDHKLKTRQDVIGCRLRPKVN